MWPFARSGLKHGFAPSCPWSVILVLLGAFGCGRCSFESYPPVDSGWDAGPDVGTDSGTGEDAGADATVDGGADAGTVDTRIDVGTDTGPADTGVDVGIDTGPDDTGVDTGPADAGPCGAALAPLVYWPFDGDATDATTGGRDLSLTAGATFGAGLFGQSLDLSASGAERADRMADDPVLNFAGDFTVHVWVNYVSVVNEQVLIEKFAGSSGPGWTLTKVRGQQLRWATDLGTLNSTVLSISTGVWHQVVVRRMGSTVMIWLNGVIVGTGTQPGPYAGTANRVRIGMRNDADGRGFPLNGSVDDVAIWTRALSDAELLALYAGGVGVPVCP